MFFFDDDDSYDDSYYSDSYMYDTDEDYDFRPRSPVLQDRMWVKDWSDSGSLFQPRLMSQEFAGSFEASFNQPQMRDVTLKVGKNQYSCHRLILCAWSEVFVKMLDDPIWSVGRKRNSGSRRQDIFQELKESEECTEVFEDFLRYLYSEEISLNLQNVWPIILLADKYIVSPLREVCVDFLKKQLDRISMEELWLVMKNSEACLVDEVRDVALIGLRANFMQMSMKMMLSMDPADITMLLDSSDIVAEDEFQLWLTVRQYLSEWKKDKSSYSEEKADKILKLIRLHQMSASQLSIVNASDYMPEIYRVHGERAMEQALLYRAQFAEECTSKLPKDIPPPRLYLHNAHFLKYNLHSSHIGYKRMLKKPEPIKLTTTVTFFRDVTLVFYVSENKPFLCQKGIDGASHSPWMFRPIFQNVANKKSGNKKIVTFVFAHEADQYGWPYKIVINVEDEKNRKRGNSRVKVVSGVVERVSKGKSPEVRVTVPGTVYVEGDKGLSAHLMVYMYVPRGKSLKPSQKGAVAVRF